MIRIKTEIRDHLARHPVQYDSVLLAFLDEHQDLTSRRNTFGHLTATAVILSPSHQQVLMIHHAKFHRWLMPGGHIENGETPLEAARREAAEEVGLHDLQPVSERLIDVDIHRIPAAPGKGEPEHWHFDLRYLFISDSLAALPDHREVTQSAWQDINNFRQRQNRRLANRIKSVIA